MRQRGGRHPKFQSTPSAWRETLRRHRTSRRVEKFQSTPSAWRETHRGTGPCQRYGISIHSLRMEGDLKNQVLGGNLHIFQSTPSAWRETRVSACRRGSGRYFNPLPPHGGRHLHRIIISVLLISIHSLRMEGDQPLFYDYIRRSGISIHSLRMEGDSARSRRMCDMPYFNPLPPHGGRLALTSAVRPFPIFQSTPSAWRETAKLHRKAFFISPILVQSCKKGCKRLHSAPEKMIFFEKREKNSVRNLQHLSVRL